MADHDVAGSQRRLRRRTRGPQDAPIELQGFVQSTTEPGPGIINMNPDYTIESPAANPENDEGMDVDGTK
jgi:hypothetical protein